MHSQVTYRYDDGFPSGLSITPDGQCSSPAGAAVIYEAFGISNEMDRVAADLTHEGGWTVPILDLPASGAAEVDRPTCAGCVGVVRIVVRNVGELCLKTALVRRCANCSRW